MPTKSKFIPYTPYPFDARHRFEKDESMDELVSQILGNHKEGALALLSWYEYFENHVLFPIDVMVECPIQKRANNSISITSKKMTLVSVAPIERCPMPFILCVARIGEDDAGRFVFVDHIRKFLDNKDAERVFLPYIYWLYFEKNKNVSGK